MIADINPLLAASIKFTREHPIGTILIKLAQDNTALAKKTNLRGVETNIHDLCTSFHTAIQLEKTRCASYRGVKGTNFLKKLRHVLPPPAVCCTPESQAPGCAAHRGVKLRGVLLTGESSSAVCITLRSQTAHRGVKTEIFGSLWLLLKGQSGKSKKELKKFFWLSKPKILTPLLCCTLRSQIFRTLWSNIWVKSTPNSKIL